MKKECAKMWNYVFSGQSYVSGCRGFAFGETFLSTYTASCRPLFLRVRFRAIFTFRIARIAILIQSWPVTECVLNHSLTASHSSSLVILDQDSPLSRCRRRLFLRIQYFVTCDTGWRKSVASCRVDWIIHRCTVGHAAHCYLTLPKTLLS